MKRDAKRILYRAAHSLRFDAAWDLARHALGRRHATILNLHRVTDEIPEDGLTIGSEKFARILRLLRQDFRVIGLAALLEELRGGQPLRRGQVVITFDDGYQDNYRVACPALRAEGLPATFFVTTGFIGTEVQTGWDAKQGVRSRWMTWEEVADLSRQGFDIGSHTVNHLDLAASPAAQVLSELRDSKRELEERLGVEVPHFAYPFGRRNQVNRGVRETARACGYACCLSAFGGHVFRGDDPLDLRRLPVNHWLGNAEELGLEITGLSALWNWRKG